MDGPCWGSLPASAPRVWQGSAGGAHSWHPDSHSALETNAHSQAAVLSAANQLMHPCWLLQVVCNLMERAQRLSFFASSCGTEIDFPLWRSVADESFNKHSSFSKIEK